MLIFGLQMKHTKITNPEETSDSESKVGILIYLKLCIYLIFYRRVKSRLENLRLN